MVYDPNQPRTPGGQFWFKDQAVGWYEYTKRNGEIGHFYNNNRSQLMTGSDILHVAAGGRVYTTKDGDPASRIHLTGTDDGELMAYASSGSGAFGIINHDREAPPNDMSMIRGHDFQPVSDRLPEDETSWGGTAANDVANNGVSTDVKYNEAANRAAFEDPNAKVYSVNPAEMAEAVVQVRHEYEKLGYSSESARNKDLYVYFNRNGELVMTPAIRLDENGKRVRRHTPNSHSGSATVKLTCADVTRMTRAMQKEGLDSVNVSISHGTNLSNNGKPVGNALHFRGECENETTGDRSTMWGTVERRNQGTEFSAPETRVGDAVSQQEYVQNRERIRKEAARKFHHPQDAQQAAKLLRARTGNHYIRPEALRLDKKGRILRKGVDYDTVYSPEGETLTTRATTERGFATIFNSKAQGRYYVDESEVVRTGRGTYSAPVYRAGGKLEGRREFNADGSAVMG